MKHLQNNNLVIASVYGYDDAIFNVGQEGSKTKFDPVTKKRFTYASGDNIKHNIKKEYSNLSNIEPPKKYFVKDVREGKEQGEVLIEVALDNPFCRIFGDWNPNPFLMKQKKYERAALKAVIELSDNQPLHPYLISTTKDVGTKRGSSTDGIVIKHDKDYLFDVEEVVNAKLATEEDALKMFNSATKMNFLEGNYRSSGIYVHNTVLRINEFKYVDVSNVILEETEKDRLIAAGYSFTTLNNKDVMVVPTDIAIRDFIFTVRALFKSDFTSNNSTHYNLREFLRTSFAINKPSYVVQSTLPIVDEVEKAARIELLTDNEAEECGVYTFTSKMMKKYTVQEGVNYTLSAEDDAIEKIIEIGTEILQNI
jgi:hypothetical protein